jgi:hypothetical protein
MTKTQTHTHYNLSAVHIHGRCQMSLILKRLISAFSYEINTDTVRWGSRVKRNLGHPPVTKKEKTFKLPQQYSNYVRPLGNKICDSSGAGSVSSLAFKWGHIRDSLVGIARGYGLYGRGSIPGRGKIFFFSIASRPALEPIQPHIQ